MYSNSMKIKDTIEGKKLKQQRDDIMTKIRELAAARDNGTPTHKALDN